MWIAIALGGALLAPIGGLGLALWWAGLLGPSSREDVLVEAAPPRRPARRIRELIPLRRDATLKLK